MARVTLGLGSNLGDRLAALRVATDLLGAHLTQIRRSRTYESSFWGHVLQSDFLNCAMVGTTTVEPQSLLAIVKEIEERLGRQPRERWGAREIDIDILLWDDRIVKEKNLVIPHPHIPTRDFVLRPLMDLDAFGVHPLLGRSWNALLVDIPHEQRTIKRILEPHEVNHG